jgi:hypothetical protein
MLARIRLVLLAGGIVLTGHAHAGPSAVSSIVDGGFDGGARGWKTIRTVPSGCETPHRSVFRGDSASTAVFLGDTRIETPPGCDPSYVFQDFDCSSADSSNDHCTVSFDASLWLVAGEHAAVVVSTEGAMVAREIPGARSGRSGRYAVSIPATGRARVVFAVWGSHGPPSGTRSLLMIDNVTAFVTDRDLSSEMLAQLHIDALPFGPRTLDGHLLQPIPDVTDCNANGVPDLFEISQGMAADSNGDGLPDGCDAEERRIDWVLLSLGVLILAVTFLRHALKGRARLV